MKFRTLILPALLAVVFSGLAFAAGNNIPPGKPINFDSPDMPPLFPFKIEKGAPDNITNVQTWEKPWAPAGSDGMMSVKDGQFVDPAGKKHYFFGSNLCFSASFPKEKEQAELLAASMARFGVNVIRLHHMDSRHIWGDHFDKTMTIIDAAQLDRLDWLISRLQHHGIYVNINLHVSRAFDERDGFQNAKGLPGHTKGVDNFEPRMIELQKKYAKDLLTHVNPYTKKAYIDDPGVAMIEINNENSVVASWSWGELDSLPEPYCNTLRDLWNNWLVKKYKTTDEIRTAWECRDFPLGDEMIVNGKFNEQTTKNFYNEKWEIQRDDVSKVTTDFYPYGEEGQHAIRINVEKLGKEFWIPQMHRTGLAVKADTIYTFSFKARAKKNGKIATGVLQNHDPWNDCGFRTEIKVSPEWKTFTYVLKSKEADDNVRVSFSSFAPGNTYEFADISLREGGTVGFDKQYSVEAKTIPVPKKNAHNALVVGKTFMADWSAFLQELENGYWQEMYQYVKSELGAKPPVTGTQLQYGFWYAQARLDYCDIHAYWNHPNFPRRPWDGNDWYLGSKSLANHIGDKYATLPSLASVRVIDRPLTVSEYDHPYPNLYCAEGNPMAAAFGAFQNWSGFYQFAWSHSDSYDPAAASTFFDMCGNQAKLAHLPACYAMFTRGDVKRGPGKYVYAPEMSDQKELDMMSDSLTGYHRDLAATLNMDKTLSLAVFAGVNLTDLKNKPEFKNVKIVESWKDLPHYLGSPDRKQIRNEFRELLWDYRDEKGYFQVDTARSMLFSGFINNRAFDYHAINIKPGKTRLDWATISLVQCNAAKKDKKVRRNGMASGRYLLTATGLVQNTNAKFVETGKDRISTAGAFGGNSGHAPVLCEGIPMDLTLKGVSPEQVKAFALDQKGDRTSEIQAVQDARGSVLKLGPEYKTVWYEIIVTR